MGVLPPWMEGPGPPAWQGLGSLPVGHPLALRQARRLGSSKDRAHCHFSWKQAPLALREEANLPHGKCGKGAGHWWGGEAPRKGEWWKPGRLKPRGDGARF